MQHNIVNRYEFAAGGQPYHAASRLSVTRILIVDSAPGASHMLVDYFQQQNMDAVSVAGRQNMLRQFAMAEPSLVILDLRPGDEDGFDLLREIRSRSDVPVIVVTEHRRDDLDRIRGLELGADHYLTKPFNPRELLARVRAVLRRQDMARAEPASRGRERGGFRFGDWQLMRKTRRLTDRQGNTVPLTKGQYALLVAFLEAPQRPLTREYLLQATRVHEDILDRSIDVQVLRLRQKLQPVPTAPRYIDTERGIGYVFAMKVERI
jgi:two-component system, OmpR family, response regulator